ncbi:GntR family transcriptional regulator [Saccharomonospora sp. NPDC046836]|uniref:GntR family transcriptional regulator n=1 Tax=Saccharomonospora sp. NPDC046836 TaxID=3156921 RepID=UPI0033D4CEB6
MYVQQGLLPEGSDFVILTGEQCDAIADILADDHARQAEVMFFAARYPQETFSLAEGFTELELRWVARIRALGERLYRLTRPRYPLYPGGAYFWEQVRDHLAERIDVGEFDRWLPPRQALAREYGVSIRTVDRAVRALAEVGRVLSFPGKGTALA